MTKSRTFEDRVCDLFGSAGYWAHRLAPNEIGAQPFDVIAIKNKDVWAIDCKLCSRAYFPFIRVELNQRLAFERLQEICPAANIGIVAGYDNTIYWVSWSLIKQLEKQGAKGVNLNECDSWC